MKKINVIILSILLSFMHTQLEGQINRSSDLQYGNLNDLELPNLSNAYRQLDKAMAEKHEKAIVDCYASLIKKFRKSVEKDEAEFDYIEPQSSWIERMEFYDEKKHGFKGCLLFTESGSQYLYKIDKRTWTSWKKSLSKREFFNHIIRDNPEFTYRELCELHVLSNN